MTNITPKHVQDMAAIMASLNAASDDVPTAAPTKSVHSPAPRAPAPITESTVAMAKIMSAFAAATDDIVAGADTYPELKKALVTEATETGARVGSWEIQGRSVDGLGKFYDVIHTLTKEPIANDLRLYEAALALVNSLHEGHTITSSVVKSILGFEEEYSRNLSNAVTYAARMKITEGAQHDIAEARYSEAKRRALLAKKNLGTFTRL